MLSRLIYAGLLGALWMPYAHAATDDQVLPSDLDRIRHAAPEQAPAKPLQPRRVLVYTACQGFRHSSIPIASAAVQILGEKSHAFETEVSDDPNVFRPDRLGRFDAVCFNNTTGELFKEDELRASLLSFVRRGNGVVGIHAATDCFYQWADFGELMGGYFDGHPWNEAVTVKIDEPRHPLNAMFAGQPFEIADEIYQFKAPYSRERLRVLLSLDSNKTNMQKDGIKRADGDFAVSWVRNYGLGRLFYCSLGHRDDVFWTPSVLQHYLAGIQFACGDLPANACPSAARAGDGWIDLFNGKDLTGWIAKPGSWAVEDQTLARRGGGDIWNEQVFGDFTLECEFKLAPKTNSGILLRASDTVDWLHKAIEIQILDSYGKAEPDPHDCGAVYDCLAPRKNAVKPPGEWNRMSITCQDCKISVVLNEEPIIAMDLDQWQEAGKNPDGTTNKFKTAYKDLARAGRIGFQDHGLPVWYRNIRILELPRGGRGAR